MPHYYPAQAWAECLNTTLTFHWIYCSSLDDYALCIIGNRMDQRYLDRENARREVGMRYPTRSIDPRYRDHRTEAVEYSTESRKAKSDTASGRSAFGYLPNITTSNPYMSSQTGSRTEDPRRKTVSGQSATQYGTGNSSTNCQTFHGRLLPPPPPPPKIECSRCHYRNVSGRMNCIRCYGELSQP